MKNLKVYESLIDDMKKLDLTKLEGWVIDYGSESGPDYNFSCIIILIAKDEESAIELLPDAFEIPDDPDEFEIGDTLEETVESILESNFFTGAGWSLELNHVEHFKSVKARKEGHYVEYYYNDGASRENLLIMGQKTEKLVKDIIG